MSEFKKTMTDLDAPPPYETHDTDTELTMSDIGPLWFQKLRKATVRAREANDVRWETEAQEWKIKAKDDFMQRFLSLAKEAAKETREYVCIDGYIKGVPVDIQKDQSYIKGIKYSSHGHCKDQFHATFKAEIFEQLESWGFQTGFAKNSCKWLISWEKKE